MRFWNRITDPKRHQTRTRNLTPKAQQEMMFRQRTMFSRPDEDSSPSSSVLSEEMQSGGENASDTSAGNADSELRKVEIGNFTQLTFKSSGISSPPTLAELDFLLPGNKRPGFVGVVQRNTSSVWLIFSDGSGFFYLEGTKAV